MRESRALKLTPALLRGDVEPGAAAALAPAVLPPAHAPPRLTVRVGDAAAAQQRHLVVMIRNGGGGGRVGEDLAAVRGSDGVGGGGPAAAVPVDRCRGVCNDGLGGMKIGTPLHAKSPIPTHTLLLGPQYAKSCIQHGPWEKLTQVDAFTVIRYVLVRAKLQMHPPVYD